MRAELITITRENAIFSLPLEPNYGGMKKAGRFLQLSGAIKHWLGVLMERRIIPRPPSSYA